MNDFLEFRVNPLDNIVNYIIKYTSKVIKEEKLQKRLTIEIKSLFVRYENECYYDCLIKYMTDNKIKNLYTEISDPLTESNYTEILKKYSEEFYDLCKKSKVNCSILEFKRFLNALCNIIKSNMLALLPENDKTDLCIIKQYSDKIYCDIKNSIEEKQAQILKTQFNIIKNVELNITVSDSIRNEFAEEYTDYLFLEKERNDTIRLCDTYIPPHYKFNNTSYNDILSFLDNFVDATTKEDVLIVSGEPAIGKSSLLKCFVYNRKQKAKDSSIIVISMKALTYNDNFSQVLCNHFSVATQHKSQFLSFKTIILDGFDEFCFVNNIREPSDIINKIWNDICGKQSGIKMAKMIVTTRDNYLDNMNKDRFLQISLQPFNEEQIKNYIDNFNEIRGDKKCVISNSIIKNLKGILSIPMILYMTLALNVILDENAGKEEVFEKIFGYDGVLINNTYKDGDYTKNKTAFLQIPQRIAFRMFKNHSYEYELSSNIKEDAIFHNFDEGQLTHIAANFGTMCYYEDDLLQTKSVKFMHKSTYEYYLAKYFFNVLIAREYNDFEEYYTTICDTFAWDDFSYLNIKKISSFDTTDNNNDILIHFKHCVKKYKIKLLKDNKDVVVNMIEKMFEKDFFDPKSYSEYINIQFKKGNKHKEQLNAINNYVKNIFSMYWNLIFIVLSFDKSVYELYESNINNIVKSEKFLNYIRKCNGDYFYLQDLQLNNLDFVRHSFVLADFERTRLNNTCFDEADLRGANFAYTDLNNASFVFADLMHSNFSNSDLTNANFVNACLYGAKFDKATFDKTIFDINNILVLVRQFKNNIECLKDVQIYNGNTKKILTFEQYYKNRII